MTSLDLAGFTVAVTADRRRDEQAVLLERIGLEAAVFPLLRTEEDDPRALRALTAGICRTPPKYLLANTGYGMRAWFGFCAEWGVLEDLVEALRPATSIAARGAKALGELRKAGLDAFYKAPGETIEEVVGRLLEEGVDGESVVVQLHGEGPGEELARLAAAGARVTYLSVYRMTTPAQGSAGGRSRTESLASRLASAVENGSIDAVTFTAAPAVEALFSVATSEREALRAAFNQRGVVAACIGPVCAAAAEGLGVEQPFVPEHPRLGSLANGLGAHLATRQILLPGRHGTARLSGRLVELPGRRQVLSPVEQRALRTLLSHGGRARGSSLPATEVELSQLSDALDGALRSDNGEWELVVR